MKLIVLMDNNTYIDRYYLGEPAVSYYIEDMDKKILFDAGYSDAFIKNAKSMDINISDLDFIILSHGHNDHTGGLEYLNKIGFNKKTNLISHPDAFLRKRADDLEIGCPINLSKLKEQSEVKLVRNPVWITNRLVFLGEIPVSNSFEERYAIGTTFKDDKEQEDYMLDDTALAYVGEKGLYIVTGCSHSGICNIISYAKEITGKRKIEAVIGGFHLFDVNDKIDKTINYLANENIKEVYPCHCTSFNVRAKMSSMMNVIEVGVGLELNWR